MEKKNIRTRLFKWTAIDKIGKLKSLQFSFLVFIILPFVAQLIEKYQLKLTIPFNWLLLYYSTLFISLGTLMYSIFCPELIKKYATFEEYEKSGREGYYLLNQLYFFVNKKRNTNVLLAQYLAQEFLFAHHTNEDRIMSILTNPTHGNHKSSFWFAHDTLNYSKLFPRLVCCLFYFIGFSLLSYVLCEKIYIVTRHFMTVHQTTI